MFFKKLLARKEAAKINKDLTERISNELRHFIDSDNERQVLSIHELSKEEAKECAQAIPLGWRNIEEGNYAYYPIECIDAPEKNFIEQDKEYTVISFVKPKTYNANTYPETGLEIISRIHSNASMPKFKNESPFHYHSIKTYFPQSDFSIFGEIAAKRKITAKDLFDPQMEAHTYYAAMDKIQKRDAPADEHIFLKMRENIAVAKYSKKN